MTAIICFLNYLVLPISKFDVISSYPITAITDMTDIDQFKTINLKLTHVSHQRIFCNYNQYLLILCNLL